MAVALCDELSSVFDNRDMHLACLRACDISIFPKLVYIFVVASEYSITEISNYEIIFFPKNYYYCEFTYLK